ncbi:serine hydrolase [Kitasatospora sp. NPDC006697]|uniref:serine hydrolase n=1 Tax=Kitasatospora sp. NPDC006697 TaxID=3364020 RepID=UPI00368E38A0
MSHEEPADLAGSAAPVPPGRSAEPHPAVGGDGAAQSAPPRLPAAALTPPSRPDPRSPSQEPPLPARPLIPPRPLRPPTVEAAADPVATRLPRRRPSAVRPTQPLGPAGRRPGGAKPAQPAVPVLPGAAARRREAESLTPDRRLRPLFQGLPPDSGVAVAVIEGDEQTVACRGFTDLATRRPIRADTRFELGSITKTFTALLLADMVARGEVRYDDPVGAYLPTEAVPGYPKERPITLFHLATHTSGLPRLPAGMPGVMPQWFTRPCATFNAAHLLRSLARTPVRGTPGTQVRYSSLGAGLLGMALANAAGSRYEDLLVHRVCEPLGLLDTSCGAAGDPGNGYRRGRRVPSFRMPALPGASALRSSADDMLRYLQALVAVDGAVPLGGTAGLLSGTDQALRTALREVRRPRVPWKLAGTRFCLGWKQRGLRDGEEEPERELVFHEGSTKGFLAFAGFDPRAGTGLVALVSAPPTRRRRFLQAAYETLRGLGGGA